MLRPDTAAIKLLGAEGVYGVYGGGAARGHVAGN
jgi:hypothetical protein